MRRPWLLDLFLQRRVRRVVLTPYQPPPAPTRTRPDPIIIERESGKPLCPGCLAPYPGDHELCDFCRSTGRGVA